MLWTNSHYHCEIFIDRPKGHIAVYTTKQYSLEDIFVNMWIYTCRNTEKLYTKMFILVIEAEFEITGYLLINLL